MKVVAIIPARGGSRGIPRKNIKVLFGKSLIGWTIEVALVAEGVDRVIVSTEDEEIAAVARQFGAEVPFIRPLDLAQDDTPSIAPVLHAIERLPDFDWVLLLQPTSPLRSVADVEGIIKFCREKHASSAVSITEVSMHPFWMYRRDEHQRLQPFMPNHLNITQRQDLPPAYVLNGALYLARTDWLIENQGFIGPKTLGYVMPEERSVDLDTPLDWQWAEFLMERMHVQ